MELETYLSTNNIPVTTSFLWSENGQLIESLFAHTEPNDEGKFNLVRKVIVSETAEGMTVYRIQNDEDKNCIICGRNHSKSDWCVTPRGTLLANDDVALVPCSCCGTLYWANGGEYDAAGGAVCPYCLTDTRKADSSVIVHTLIEAMPHEFIVSPGVRKARNFLGELVDFNAAREVPEKRTKRRKAKRAS